MEEIKKIIRLLEMNVVVTSQYPSVNQRTQDALSIAHLAQNKLDGLNALLAALEYVGSILTVHRIRTVLRQKQSEEGKAIKRTEELNAYQMEMLFIEKLCPDCGHSEFLAGPEGGCSQNIKCNNCGSKFNICPPFFAERI
jgi:hypothetical protein